jgi:hypothetical protein
VLPTVSVGADGAFGACAAGVPSAALDQAPVPAAFLARTRTL